jgi:hypothetical protein
MCDKGDFTPHGNGYAEFYDLWFDKKKYTAKNICEVGVLDGKSLHCYYDYFPNSKILGLDIFDKTHLNNERINTKIIDQSSESDLTNFVNECVSQNLYFDIIIDDGSHDILHQQLTFGHLFKLVKPNGYYIIEDMGSSYFNLETNHNGYKTTQTKINNNTIKFLQQRPFSSIWISEKNINYINENVKFVSIFDKTNYDLPYSNSFNCVNNYPIRSITSIIVKK